MGMHPQQYWQTSTNGKAMVMMLAQRHNPELVKEICEWLVGVFEKDLQAAAIQKGANAEQAKTYAHDGAAHLYSQVYAIDGRNQVMTAGMVIDQVFRRHYHAGAQHYAHAMAWFADELRKRVKNDDDPR